MSATVKFITKYILRERRFLFFIKMMIDRRFTVTIATDIVRNAANQVMHSGEESIVDCPLSTFKFQSSFSCSATYKKDSSKVA